MINFLKGIIYVLILVNVTYSQVASVISGGVSTGSGGSLSYSIGQVSYSTSTNSFGTLSEGIQQTVSANDFQQPVMPSKIYGYTTSRVAITDVTDSFITGKTIRYTIKKIPNATFYRWSFTGYANNSEILTNDTFFAIRFPVGITTGTLSVKASNDFYTSLPKTLLIKIVPPSTPAALYGFSSNKTALTDVTDSVINAHTVRYSVKQVRYANKYLWEVTGDASINGPSLTSDTFVNVLFRKGFTTGTVKVWAVRSGSYTNLKSSSFKSIATKIILPSTPISIYGFNASRSAVLDVTDSMAWGKAVSYSIRKVNLANKYVWSSTGGVSILTDSISSDTTIKILFPPNFTGGSISVKSLRSGTDTTFSSVLSRIISVRKVLPATSSIITKVSSGLIYDSIAAGKTVTFHLAARTPYATGYEWTLVASASSLSPAQGAWIVDQPNDTSVTIRFATSESYFTGCALRVRSIRGGPVVNFYSSTYRILSILPGTTPMPSPINASASPVSGAIITYAVDSLEKTSYTWTVPSIVTVIGSRTGSSIKVQYKSSYIMGTSVNFSVRAKSVYGLISPMRTGVFSSATARLSQLQNSVNTTDDKAISNIIYPNPNKGSFHIKINTGISQETDAVIQIFDSKGALVGEHHVLNKNNYITYEVINNKLSTGLYLLLWKIPTVNISGSNQFVVEK